MRKSRNMGLGELPFKLWHRYLPDYFNAVIKKLFDIPSVDVLDYILIYGDMLIIRSMTGEVEYDV